MTAQIRTPEGSGCGNSETTLASVPVETAVNTPAASAPASVEPTYERVDLDRYVVLHDGPVGYVESVPPLFVCYVGHPYPQAEEIAQVHDFHQAIDAVIGRVESARRSKLSA